MTDRPHCLVPNACTAKTRGKHCIRCTAAMPDVRARKSAAIHDAFARDPEMLERRRASARALLAHPKTAEARGRRNQEPEVRARQREGCKISIARRIAEDPTLMDRIRAAGRKGGLASKQSGCSTPAARKKAGAAIQAAALAWCPKQYWDLNHKLKGLGYRLAERKQMIADEIATTARREIETFNRKQRERVERERAQAY